MPVIRDPAAIQNTDKSWSQLQHAVSNEIPRSVRNTAHAIRKIQRMRKSR